MAIVGGKVDRRLNLLEGGGSRISTNLDSRFKVKLSDGK